MHLYNAEVARQYSGADGGLFRQFFTLSPMWESNRLLQVFFGHALVFLPPAVVEKLFVTVYFVLFGLSLRYLLATLRGGSTFLSVPGLAMAPNWFLFMGFYPFCLALPGLMLALAVGWRWRRSMRPRQTLILGLLLIGLYSLHAVPAGIAIFALIAIHAVRWVQSLTGKCVRWAWLQVVAACVPAATLILTYVLTRPTEPAEEAMRSPSQLSNLKKLLSLHTLISFGQQEDLPARGLALLMGVLALLALRSPRLRLRLGNRAGWLVTPIVLLMLLMVFPSALAGHGYIDARLAYLAVLLVIPVLAAGVYSRRVQVASVLAGVLFVATQAVLHTTAYAAVNEEFARREACDASVPRGGTFLNIAYASFGENGRSQPLAQEVRPFAFHSLRLASERGLVSLANPTAEFALALHIIRYREAVNPYGRLVPTPGQRRALARTIRERFSYHFRIRDYEAATGVKVDMVHISGWHEGLWAAPGVKATFEEIAQGFDLVCSGQGEGVRLYRRKP